MTHDPFCLLAEHETHAGDYWCDSDCERECICDLIARVREDERDCDAHGDTIRYRCSHYQQGRKDGYASALKDAMEAVKLSCSADIELVERTEVIVAIEALGGQR